MVRKLWKVVTLLVYVVTLLRDQELSKQYNWVRIAGILTYFAPLHPFVPFLANTLLFDNLDCWLFPTRNDDAPVGKHCESLAYQRSDKLYDITSSTMVLLDIPDPEPVLLFIYAIRAVADLYVYRTGDTSILRIIPNFFEVWVLVRYLSPSHPVFWLFLGSIAKIVQEQVLHSP